jgi:YopX protein
MVQLHPGAPFVDIAGGFVREIKFRAWMPDCSDGRSIGGRNPSGNIMISENNWMCMDALKNGWPVMQFTGLYDKNNAEIYEGDILTSDTGYIYKVEFSPDSASFRFYDEDDDLGESLSAFHDEYVIIGNIFENPTLMKKEKKMPFKSKAQQKYLFAKKPQMAKEWADETPNIKKLPTKVNKKAKKR